MGNKKNKKNKKKGGGGGGKKKNNKIAVAPTFTRQANVEDFLDETEMKSHERYGCIMFASPGETMREQFKEQIAVSLGVGVDVVSRVVDEYIALEHPKRAVKYVGGRQTPEECSDLIKELMEEEGSFHIYTTENGKWITFDPNPELIEDENYREQQLNEIIRGKKMAEKRTKQFFRSEMRKRVEKARLEGTKEGQQILLEAEEPLEAVQGRAEAAAEAIEEYRTKIVEMERTRELAEQKLAKLRESGVQPEVEKEALLQQLAERKRAEQTVMSDGDRALAQFNERTIRRQLQEMGEIESQRKYPDDLAAATAEKMKQANPAANLPQPPEAVLQQMKQRQSEHAAIFEDSPIIPSATKSLNTDKQ